MNNVQLSLNDRVISRLTAHPEILDMSEFSCRSRTSKSRTKTLKTLKTLKLRKARTPCGTTYCLAGLILDESGVHMAYDSEGFAIGLGEGESPPQRRWIDHEVSLSEGAIDPFTIMIAAKARELWAAEHGDESAKSLPFYARDWGFKPRDFSTVGPVAMIHVLRTINEYHASKNLKMAS